MGYLPLFLIYLAVFIITVNGHFKYQNEEGEPNLDLELRLRPPGVIAQPARIQQPTPTQPLNTAPAGKPIFPPAQKQKPLFRPAQNPPAQPLNTAPPGKPLFAQTQKQEPLFRKAQNQPALPLNHAPPGKPLFPQTQKQEPLFRPVQNQQSPFPHAQNQPTFAVRSIYSGSIQKQPLPEESVKSSTGNNYETNIDDRGETHKRPVADDEAESIFAPDQAKKRATRKRAVKGNKRGAEESTRKGKGLAHATIPDARAAQGHATQGQGHVAPPPYLSPDTPQDLRAFVTPDGRWAIFPNNAGLPRIV